MSLRNFLLNLFFPLACLGCGREGARLCPECFAKLKINPPEANRDSRLVADHLDWIFIAGDYDDPLLKDLIKKFKYQFQIGLGEPLAGFLAEFWRTARRADEFFSIVPIPLTRRRLNWRGFNQAEILARHFCTRFNYELAAGLKRIRHRPPQAELKESERLENVSGVFAWSGKNSGLNLNGQSLILIDDVTTTGATLNEAARVLREAGAARIYGLVLAKG